MRNLLITAGILATSVSSAAFGDGLTYGSLSGQYLTGDIDRDGLESSFEDYSRIEGALRYETGAVTLYGDLSFDRADFTGDGDDNDVVKGDLFEVGAEYTRGDFSFGANFSTYQTEDEGFGADLESIALYGQYAPGPYFVGLAAFTVEIDEFDLEDEGYAIFGGYDNGQGFDIGGQYSESDDGSLLYLYASYENAMFEVAFDYVDDDDDSTFAKLSGAYNINETYSVIAGVVDLSFDDDGTRETFIGGRYAIDATTVAELAYYYFDAFNDFDGDGISFKVTYEIGDNPRGFQSISKQTDKLFSPIFFVF